MNKTYILIALWIIALIGMGSGQLYFKNNQTVDLKIPCFNNGTYCPSTAFCNITITKPTGDTLINNQEMTNSISYYNYTIGEFVDFGIYPTTMMCMDTNGNGYKTFEIQITPNGKEPAGDNLKIFIYILFGLLTMALAFTFIINIGKLATISTSIFDVALSLGFYFITLFVLWLSNEYITSALVRDNMVLYVAMTTFTNGFLPFIGLVITMIWKGTQKKKGGWIDG
jgi:hypothetical protein